MANCGDNPTAFLVPAGSRLLSTRRTTLSFSKTSSTRPKLTMSTRQQKSHKLNLVQAALIAAGGVAGTLLGTRKQPFRPLPAASAVTVNITQHSNTNGPMPLSALGVKRDEYVGERELRRRKTTQYSEAEEEIMELEEWEVETQWFRDLQAMWAGIASVAGIFVLYKGGVMWENWIKEQEQKDMEEEIKLTGTFIDPRAIRKDENDEGGKPKKKDKPKTDPQGPSGEGEGGDVPPGGLDSLEKLFGSS